MYDIILLGYLGFLCVFEVYLIILIKIAKYQLSGLKSQIMHTIVFSSIILILKQNQSRANTFKSTTTSNIKKFDTNKLFSTCIWDFEGEEVPLKTDNFNITIFDGERGNITKNW